MVCIDDEIPFEIPASWEWCRITHLANSLLGKTLDRGKEQGKEYPYLCSINVYWNRIDLTKVKSFKLQENELERYRLQNGDLLICEGGDYGRCAVWDRDEEMYYQNALHRVRFFCNSSPSFFKNVFEFYRQVGYIVGQGQTIKHFTYENMKSLLFPLPPYKEQIRITNKLNQILELVNNYEESQERLDRINIQINDLLKKSILQEAIRGKLVSQDASEEPASILLQRIKEKKMNLVKEGKLKKRGVIDSTIFRGDDNKYYEQIGKNCIDITADIPFDLPSNWVWTRIGNLFAHNNGKQLNKGNSDGILMEYITTSNLYWDGFRLDNLKRMPFEASEIERCQAIKGDLLVCEGGDVGRSCIWTSDNPIMLQNHIHKLRAYIPQCTKYFYFIFYYYNITGMIGGKGIGIQGFSSKALHNTLVPLPPIEEQSRIVERIDQLFQLSD